MNASGHAAALGDDHGGDHDTAAPTVNPQIAYATPVPTGSPVSAGVALMLGGLGLVLLGGCFLIGVLLATEVSRENAVQGGPGITRSVVVLLCVLYFATFACFSGAVLLLVKGTRALLRVVRS